MTDSITKTKWLTVPNFFSYLRIASVPFLFYIAWEGYPNLFLVVLEIYHFEQFKHDCAPLSF